MGKLCSKCRKNKPIEEFGQHRHHKDGLRSWCKACTNERMREYHQQPAMRARRKEYCQRPEVKEHIRKQQQEHRQRPEVKAYAKERMHKYRQRPEIRAHKKEQSHKYHVLLRGAAFAKISHGVPHCGLCGCIEDRWLTIDHKNGDGAEHRRERQGNYASWIYRSVISDSNPKERYRILCLLCNDALPLYSNNERALKCAIQRNNERIINKYLNLNSRKEK